jgi:hypothetical protein
VLLFQQDARVTEELVLVFGWEAPEEGNAAFDDESPAVGEGFSAEACAAS